MSSLLFPLYQKIGVTFQGQLSWSFALNWLFMILFILWFTILRKSLMNSFFRKYLENIFKYKIIAKYLMWNIMFIFFCTLIEIESIIYSIGLLISLFFTTGWLIIALLYFYWFVLNSQSEFLLWKTFNWINAIKDEFIMINNIGTINCSYFIRYNWIRKILFALIMSLFYKYKFSPYLFAFTCIPLQVIYFWLSFVVSTFHSPVKGLIFVLNESILTIVIFMTTVIHMNTKINDITYMIRFSDTLLIWIRLQILGTIAFEILSLILSQIRRIISSIWRSLSKV